MLVKKLYIQTHSLKFFCKKTTEKPKDMEVKGSLGEGTLQSSTQKPMHISVDITQNRHQTMVEPMPFEGCIQPLNLFPNFSS